MTPAGRNDPCPCGSGRKFKRCHGSKSSSESASASPQDLTWRRLRSAMEDFTAEVLRFIRDVYGVGVVHEAWAEFVVWDEDDEGFDPDTPYLPVFMPWFFHRWAPDPRETIVADASLHDRSPTSELIKRRGWRLDPLMLRYLKACATTHFSFHEVLDCEPGRGFRARDMFLGEEHEVLEASASTTLRVGDLFFGQLVTSDGVTLMEACSPRAIPPGERIPLIELRERIFGAGNPRTVATLTEWDAELRYAWLGIHHELVNPPRPAIRNTDGEAFVLHRLTFEVTSTQRAFDALRHLCHDETEGELLESAEVDEEGRVQRVSFPWTVAGNRQNPGWDNTVLGQIDIDGRQLVVDVNSAERAARFRTVVDDRLGEDARLEATEVGSVGEAKEGPRWGAAPAPEPGAEMARLAESPEVRQKVAELMTAHYAQWESLEIPALGGLTPREACQDRVGREKVEALVSQIERDSRRMQPPPDEALFRELRERLGLPPRG